MFKHPSAVVSMGASLLALTVWLPVTYAATPSAEAALKYTPTQDAGDYDRPKPEDVTKCRITARDLEGRKGWVVESPEGIILRKFVDTNGDNVVDQWSYYKDGVEVYRDIDSKFTGRADNFRWFHTAGTRWGVDTSGKGRIEAWKVLSAEEASAEIVAALASRDLDRFRRVLLSPSELQSLGLGKARAEALAQKITKAESEFQTRAAKQQALSRDTKWLQFSGTRPGTVPVGTEDSTKDLRVYENVVAIVQNGEKHGQVQIGTLVQVGDTWKVIDAPDVASEGQAEVAASGFFFRPASGNRPATATGSGPSEEIQAMMDQLQALDAKASQAATPDAAAKFNTERADLLEKVGDRVRTPEERTMWYRQLIDSIGAAVQAGKFPDGDKRLQALYEKLRKSDADKVLAAHAKISQITATYAAKIQAPKADFAAVQAQLQKDLEQFISDYPNVPDAAEAMLQLGIAREFAGEDEDARKWYRRIVKEFPDTPQAKKATGAGVRLDSVGQPITLSGKNVAGGTVDLANYRGKVVLIQYWATWYAPGKNDMAALKQMVSRFGSGFTVITVSLDNSARDLGAFLSDNKLPWSVIFEEGGLDSPPANALGILTVPTMILVDQQGKVVQRNVQMTEVEGEVKKLLGK